MDADSKAREWVKTNLNEKGDFAGWVFEERFKDTIP